MSTSLLYHMFGIRGYECSKIDYFKGRAAFVIEQPRERLRCPECGSADVHAQGHKDRFVQTVPIGLQTMSCRRPLSSRTVSRACPQCAFFG